MIFKKSFYAILLLSFLFLGSTLKANAYSAGHDFKYIDRGGIFTNTSTPVDVAKISPEQKDIDLSTLKVGESTTRNILYVVEIGDASISEAAKRGGITNVKYVDSQTCKVLIPLAFIPILIKETKTVVYGE